jgi:hypothetical protein
MEQAFQLKSWKAFFPGTADQFAGLAKPPTSVLFFLSTGRMENILPVKVKGAQALGSCIIVQAGLRLSPHSGFCL